MKCNEPNSRLLRIVFNINALAPSLIVLTSVTAESRDVFNQRAATGVLLSGCCALLCAFACNTFFDRKEMTQQFLKLACIFILLSVISVILL